MGLSGILWYGWSPFVDLKALSAAPSGELALFLAASDLRTESGAIEHRAILYAVAGPTSDGEYRWLGACGDRIAPTVREVAGQLGRPVDLKFLADVATMSSDVNLRVRAKLESTTMTTVAATGSARCTAEVSSLLEAVHSDFVEHNHHSMTMWPNPDGSTVTVQSIEFTSAERAALTAEYPTCIVWVDQPGVPAINESSE
jgi:hypothetical protein